MYLLEGRVLGMYCVYVPYIWCEEIVFKMFNPILLLNIVYIDKGKNNT